MYRGVEYPVYQRILSIQRVALDLLLDPATLTRLQDSALKCDKEDNPVTVAEVFRALTDSVWVDLGAAPTKSNASALIIRRNLQREHLKELTTLVLGERPGSGGFPMSLLARGTAPPDAKSLARMHLRDVQKKIEATLKEKGSNLDDTSRAHLAECQERIAKVLTASMQVNEP